MSQGVKVIIGLLAGLMLIMIVSVLVWIVTTVNQLSKNTAKLEQTTQKLTDSTNETATRVNTLETKGFETAKEIKNIHKDVDTLNKDVGDLAMATGYQLKDIKGAIVEQNFQMDIRISDIEQKNEEYAEKFEELNRLLASLKTSSEQPKSADKTAGRIFLNVNNPEGPIGWDEQYTVKLRSIVANKQNFMIDWGKPFQAKDISPDKPNIVKKTPKFKYANHLYFFLELGDAHDNRIVGVIDFATTDKKYFPFDLYLDKDRDGNLAEDLISGFSACLTYLVTGIKVPYKDGTTEEYSLELYAPQNEGKVSVWYQPKAGRYGVLEANQKRIGILVLDNSGKGLFNDSDEAILMDWDLDGVIDGSYQNKNDRGLYSALELPGATYRVTKIDAPGRSITLERMH
jgi:hypothetical protein